MTSPACCWCSIGRADIRCHGCYRTVCAACALETRCHCGRSWGWTDLDVLAEDHALEAYRDEVTMRALGWEPADGGKGWER